MPPWSPIYASEGVERARLRRMANHATRPAINAAPKMPPTTPPAIAPPFELPLEDDDEEDADAGVDAGVRVDWLPLVKVGTMEALPVTSGESVTEPQIRKRRGLLAKLRTTSSLRQGYTPSIAGSWVKICPRWHSRPRGDGIREAEGWGWIQKLAETMCYLRSSSCYRGAIGVPHGVGNPHLSLARSTSTDETVCDRIAFAYIGIICRLTVRTEVWMLWEQCRHWERTIVTHGDQVSCH